MIFFGDKSVLLFGHTRYFTQVDSYSAFFDNTGEEGAGSTGLAEQIAGTTEVLIFLKSRTLLWSILFRMFFHSSLLILRSL